MKELTPSRAGKSPAEGDEKYMKLHKARFANTGRVIPETYETPSGLYQIEKGTKGWNLYEKGRYGLEFICTYDRLRDVRNDPNIK